MKRNELIYDDFKFEKPFGLHGLYKNISALLRVNKHWVNVSSTVTR